MSLTSHHLWGLGFLSACVFVGGLPQPQAACHLSTLPSPWDYDLDDIQYFPAGPEFLLPNTVRAHEEYKAAQAGEDAKPYNPRP